MCRMFRDCLAVSSLMVLLLSGCGGGGSGGSGKLTTLQRPTLTATENRVGLRSSNQLLSETKSYAHSLVRTEAAFSAGVRGNGVTVAVLDGEIDVTHPDLRGAFQYDGAHIKGYNFAEGHKDVRPVMQRLNNPRRDITEDIVAAKKAIAEAEAKFGASFSRGISHGTHVSGIIAARDNNIGVLGIAPEATILPVTISRDFDRNTYRFGLYGLKAANLADWNDKVRNAVRFATKNEAKIINGSWGLDWHTHEIRTVHEGKTVYFRLLNFYLHHDPLVRTDYHRQIFEVGSNPGDNASGAWQEAIKSGSIAVFSAGNDGWNSVNGEHNVYAKPVLGRLPKDYQNEEPADWIRTVERSVTFENQPGVRVIVPANIPNFESSYFLTNPKLKGAWLAVVSVTKEKIISSFSNGCGRARDYCLAAPGSNILSTFAKGEEADIADSPSGVKSISKKGDVDTVTGDGYGIYSGTSMAAPIVSGALALLRSRHPVMSAKDAVRLLLCTAEDLEKNPAKKKSISECVDHPTSHEGRQPKSGWEPSKVYGHGLVNLRDALEFPIGIFELFDGNRQTLAGVNPHNTRFSFSNAFGNSAAKQKLNFGVLDMFGRSFGYTAPLSSKSIPTPQIGDVVRLHKITPAWGIIDETVGHKTVMRWSSDVNSRVGDGGEVTIRAGKTLAKFGFSRNHRMLSTMPLGVLQMGNPETGGRSSYDDGYNTTMWSKISANATGLMRGEAKLDIAKGVRAGLHFSQGTLGNPNIQTAAYGFHDYGSSLSLRRGDVQIGLRAGRFIEDDHFLGSKAEGGYALASDGRSSYANLSIDWTMGDWNVASHLTRVKTDVDFKHNAFVDDLKINASACSFAVRKQRVGRNHGAASLSLKMPLAVDRGTLTQNSVRGYTSEGGYKVVSDKLDLAVKGRHQILQFDYKATISPGVSWFASVSAHRNWGNFSDTRNRMFFTGTNTLF